MLYLYQQEDQRKKIQVCLTERSYHALILRVLLRRSVYKRPTECIYLTEVVPNISQEFNFHTNQNTGNKVLYCLSENRQGCERPLRSSSPTINLSPSFPSKQYPSVQHLPKHFLNTSRDSDCTTSLGSLFQHHSTHSENLFLIFNLNHPSPT